MTHGTSFPHHLSEAFDETSTTKEKVPLLRVELENLKAVQA